MSDEFKQIVDRAIILLKASSDFIEENDLEELTVTYDQTECDGACLRGECEGIVEDLKKWRESNP